MIKNICHRLQKKDMSVASKLLIREQVHRLLGKHKGKNLLRALMAEKERERG